MLRNLNNFKKIKIFQFFISIKIILHLKNDFIFIMSKNIILATIYKLVFLRQH